MLTLELHCTESDSRQLPVFDDNDDDDQNDDDDNHGNDGKYDENHDSDDVDTGCIALRVTAASSSRSIQ